MTPRERIIKLLLRLLSQPYRFTKKQLATEYGVSRDAISEDFQAIKNCGLNMDRDEQHRYAVLPNREFAELKYLQPLTNEDKARIDEVLKYVSNKDALYIRKKLESLYDFQQLGLRALRKPALEKVDKLIAARNQKKRVVLENYRSRSNNIKNRLVEPFQLEIDKHTLQAFDVAAKANRHYRLSRIERVKLTDEPWQFDNQHIVQATDVFRIADNKQVTVNLTLDVFAYNSLTEEFPLTRTYLEPGSESNTYDLQCQVNHTFKGLLNFLLANHDHVTILSPDTLKTKLKQEAEKILKKY